MSIDADWLSPLAAPPTARYHPAARWFHWTTALLIFAIVPLGWIFAEFKTKPGGVFEAPLPGTVATYASLHKTLGLLVLALVALRLVNRLVDRPPALPARLSRVQAVLAHATHWLLYIVLLGMPISGYVTSSGSKNPISVFGLFDFPKLPIDPGIAHSAGQVHVLMQFALFALVIVHVAGTAWHLFVRRDDLLARMLPRQANAD